MLAAIVCGLGGFPIGGLLLVGAIATDGAVEVHAALQLLGWCGLFVLGVAMHVVPRFHDNAPLVFPWPQRLSLGLIVGGLFGDAVARIGLARAGGELIAAISAIAVGAGMLTAAATLGPVLRYPTTSPRPVTHWLWLGTAGACLTATFYTAHGIAQAGGVPGPEAAHWRRAYQATALYLFILPFAFGISARAFAGLLAWRPRRHLLDRIAVALLGAGGITVAAGEVLGRRDVAGAGALGVACAILAFLAGVRALEPPDGQTGPAWFRRLLRLAHLWLACAAVLVGWSALDALGFEVRGERATWPALHALTVGYLSVLILLGAARLLPLFEGRALRFQVALPVAVFALTTSTVVRTLDAFVALPPAWVNAAAGLGGVGYVAGVAPLLTLLLSAPRPGGR